MKLRTQPLLLCALIGFFSASCTVRSQSGYSFDYKGATSSFRQQGEVPGATKQVDIDHRFGDVHVSQVAAGETPGWRWELTTWAEDQETARGFLDEITLETTSEGERMTLKLVLPGNPGYKLHGIKSKLWVSLGGDMNVDLDNMHGDATLIGLACDIRADLAHGKASYQGLTGGLELEHAHGAVVLTDVQGGQLTLAHGSLKASRINRKFKLDVRHSEVQLSEVLADLELDAAFTQTDVTDIEGALRFDGRHSKLNLNGNPKSLDLKSEFGDLDIRSEEHGLMSVRADFNHCDFILTLPSDSQVRLSAKSEHGSAMSELPGSQADSAVSIQVTHEFGDFRVRGAN